MATEFEFCHVQYKFDVVLDDLYLTDLVNVISVVVTCELNVPVAVRCIVSIIGGEQATINHQAETRWL
jgi:hypothetical protein